MPAATRNRLSPKGRATIARAARRRWRAFRKAVKAGDKRAARRFLGRSR